MSRRMGKATRLLIILLLNDKISKLSSITLIFLIDHGCFRHPVPRAPADLRKYMGILILIFVNLFRCPLGLESAGQGGRSPNAFGVGTRKKRKERKGEWGAEEKRRQTTH